MKIGFIYEHPTWSNELISCLESNGIILDLKNVADLAFDTHPDHGDNQLWINRVNIMPSAQRNPAVVFHTLHYLNWLEHSGARVINGARAHYVGASKAMQNAVFASLKLHYPRAVAIHRPEDALDAARQIGYPVIVKPNIGGSGSGVSKRNSEVELAEAVKFKMLDLGVDNTGLVQQYIESDGFIYRVEILGDQLFYAIRQPIQEGTFNYCAADGCHTDPEPNDEFDFCAIDGADRISTFEPDADTVEQVVQIVQATGADVGGVEYLVDRKTGQLCYYDFNPYSNFVTNGESLLGFSPEQRYTDFILEKARNSP